MEKKLSFFLCVIFFIMLAMQPLFSTERKRIAVAYQKAKKYYYEGMDYVKKGQLEKAQEKFIKSVETDLNFAESYVELGNIDMKKGLYDEALTHYDQAEQAYLRLETYVAEGIIDTTASTREEDVFSRDLYRDLAKHQFVVPPKVYLFKGGAYFRKGIIPEAIKQFHQALEINPEYEKAHNNLAVCYYLTHNYELAWKHLRLAEKYGAEINPQFIEDLKKACPEPVEESEIKEKSPQE